MTMKLLEGMNNATLEKLKRMMTWSVILLMMATGTTFAGDGYPPETH